MPLYTNNNRSRAKHQPRDGVTSRSGFTLVEMMVAIMILSVGLLGVASTSAVVTRQVAGGSNLATAGQVAEARLEKLRSLGCTKVTNGSTTTRRVSESWVRGAIKNRVLWVTHTVTYNVAGSKKASTTHVYSIPVPCSS